MPTTRCCSSIQRKPPWLRRRLPSGPEYERLRRLLKAGRLHTVCQEAKCPNVFECFSARTATFLILGPRCSRNCRFCSVQGGDPAPVDPLEPQRVADAAVSLNLRYVVVTSVTRDDLADGGAGQFAATIIAIRRQLPGTRVEVLIPDFQGRRHPLETVLKAGPDVLNHNIETVPRLYPTVRPEADYLQSLTLLARSLEIAPGVPTKSGVMLGLGEDDDELRQVLTDLRSVGCSLLTLGQYLQPTRDQLDVARFIPPESFAQWEAEARQMGFAQVVSGPFVRSSYHAGDHYDDLCAAAGSSPTAP
jgi:lipoic acid synthetase